jgi:hypothetical protein
MERGLCQEVEFLFFFSLLKQLLQSGSRHLFHQHTLSRQQFCVNDWQIAALHTLRELL